MTKKTTTYYNVADDIEAYPEAWCFIIVGGRNTGKTYSGIKWNKDNNLRHVFLKRTNQDVKLLCSGNQLGGKSANYEIDLSPYKSINRDMGTNIKAFKIDEGLGAFYNTDDEGGAAGAPEGYLLSLSAVHKYKGFDLSDCADIIWDEFKPQPWERVSRSEGEQLMELYKTVARDRALRGKPELKLFCFANAVNVFDYTSEILEVTDIIADMSINHIETKYLEDRRIFIRILETSEEMMEAERKTGIYQAMGNTAWGRVAFGNEFAYNDFSNIGRISLKGYRPVAELIYKGKPCYIYRKEGNKYYVCNAKAPCKKTYNIDKEMDRIAFYLDLGLTIRSACIDGLCVFEKYSMYDLIVNYKKRFKI